MQNSIDKQWSKCNNLTKGKKHTEIEMEFSTYVTVDSGVHQSDAGARHINDLPNEVIS